MGTGQKPTGSPLVDAVAADIAEGAKQRQSPLGGFLGFGGERVSEAEQQALDKLKATLA